MINEYALEELRSSSLISRDDVYLSPDNVYALAELDVFRANLRAALARQVMSNTAMLAAAEAFCREYAPEGSEEYHNILRAYAYREVMEIVGGDW